MIPPLLLFLIPSFLNKASKETRSMASLFFYLAQNMIMRLLELEIHLMFCPITQLEDELAAGILPQTLGLPHVGVGIRRGIIRETTPTRCHGLLDGIKRCIGGAGNLLRHGIA